MNESIEHIIRQIKNAREEQGLSQRALSHKAGIPQSHISKIENGAVNLQLSSLVELARVLNLELMLIPKHATKITSQAIKATKNSISANLPLRRLQKYAARATPGDNWYPAAQQILETTKDLEYFGISPQEYKTLTKFADEFKAAIQLAGGTKTIERMAREVQTFRHELAHMGGSTNKQTPMFQLDEED